MKIMRVKQQDGTLVDVPIGPGVPGAPGKSAYEYAQEGGYNGTESEFSAKIAKEYNANPLYGKKVSFLGDSICAGRNDTHLGGYGKIIADRNNMIYENLAVGGATVTAGTISMSTGQNRVWLCRKIAEMSADADYAIIEGGINDAWYVGEGRELEIGSISDGYNATLDDTTYYGAFESMLKQLVTRFAGKKIGYITVPKIMNMYDSEQNVPNFYHIALECCAKWGVPVCDLNTIVPPFTQITELKNAYAPDGTHPNYDGYLKYYCDPIEEWMKNLTVGGNNSASTARKAVEAYNQGINDAILALQKGKLDNTGISFRRAKLPLADGTILEIDVLTAVDGTVVIPYVNRVPISIDTDGSVFNEIGYMYGYRLSSSGATKTQSDSVVTGYIPAKNGDVIRILGAEWANTNHASNYICAYNSAFEFICGFATVAGSTTLTQYPPGAYLYSDYIFDNDGNATITLQADDAAYIRVSSCGLLSNDNVIPDGSKMIVTINEEIV